MAITVDCSKFRLPNVTDTCAVWNCLSSAVLFEAAIASKCSFCIVDFVHYECLLKERTKHREEDDALRTRLRREIERRRVQRASITISELQDVADLEERQRLGKGELASIVFARRSGQAFLTDDQAARKLAASVMDRKRVQTTPHLLGWLFYTERLIDGDLSQIVEQHQQVEGILSEFFEVMYREALRCRLAGSETGGKTDTDSGC